MSTLRLVSALALLDRYASGKTTAPSQHLQYERIDLQSLDRELQTLLHFYSMKSPNLHFINQDNAIFHYSTYQLSGKLHLDHCGISIAMFMTITNCSQRGCTT